MGGLTEVELPKVEEPVELTSPLEVTRVSNWLKYSSRVSDL